MATIFLAGAAFCFWHGVRGLRGGPVWVDASDDTGELDDLNPHPLYGRGARVLGGIFFLTGGGCVAVVLQMFF